MIGHSMDKRTHPIMSDTSRTADGPDMASRLVDNGHTRQYWAPHERRTVQIWRDASWTNERTRQWRTAFANALTPERPNARTPMSRANAPNSGLGYKKQRRAAWPTKEPLIRLQDARRKSWAKAFWMLASSRTALETRPICAAPRCFCWRR